MKIYVTKEEAFWKRKELKTVFRSADDGHLGYFLPNGDELIEL